jgi:predicted GH43/DUF377 family glycosyl hydrolase
MFTRHPENPIVRPGIYDWRRCVTFNPAVILEDGRFYLYERAGGSLRPFRNTIGMLASDDGVHFVHVSDGPVFTPEMAGSEYGSVQDPRVVHIEDAWYMTYAFRPYAWSLVPTGIGVPEAFEPEYPGFDGDSAKNQTRSGIAVSRDRVHWEHLAWTGPDGYDDRNNILFPGRINGRYALLRRPRGFVGTDVGSGCMGIQLSYSEDLRSWSEPVTVAEPAYWWEGNRIGGSTPPILTRHGWLALFHGVEDVDESINRCCYRMGAMLLDRHDPTIVLARTPEPLMQPAEYYELHGTVIPNVVFPTGAVVNGDELWVYYGCCDTAIGLATAPLQAVLDHLLCCPLP